MFKLEINLSDSGELEVTGDGTCTGGDMLNILLSMINITVKEYDNGKHKFAFVSSLIARSVEDLLSEGAITEEDIKDCNKEQLERAGTKSVVDEKEEYVDKLREDILFTK